MPLMFAARGGRFLAARRYQYIIDSACTDDGFSCDMTGVCTGSLSPTPTGWRPVAKSQGNPATIIRLLPLLLGLGVGAVFVLAMRVSMFLQCEVRRRSGATMYASVFS